MLQGMLTRLLCMSFPGDEQECIMVAQKEIGVKLDTMLRAATEERMNMFVVCSRRWRTGESSVRLYSL